MGRIPKSRVRPQSMTPMSSGRFRQCMDMVLLQGAPSTHDPTRVRAGCGRCAGKENMRRFQENSDENTNLQHPGRQRSL